MTGFYISVLFTINIAIKPTLNHAKPATVVIRPVVRDETVVPGLSSKGLPPIAMFELAAIAFTHGLGSPEYKEAAERRAREQGGKKFWK